MISFTALTSLYKVVYTGERVEISKIIEWKSTKMIRNTLLFVSIATCQVLAVPFWEFYLIQGSNF
jgi:hypothetical protein